MILFDSHCHLDDEKFSADRVEMLTRLRAAGVEKCVTVGSDIPSSRRCAALAKQYDFVYAAAGVHPHEAAEAGQYIDDLSELLMQNKVVALGEIGLDYHYDFSPRDTQKRVMLEQMALARSLHKPCIFHIREAHGEMLNIFRAQERLPHGVIHCFSGSAETAKEYLRMGFFISFAGAVTFKNARGLIDAALAVPDDRLLIETDSPYLSPEPLRGRRNEPANVRLTLEKLAQIRQTPADELSKITYRNACDLYGIAP